MWRRTAIVLIPLAVAFSACDRARPPAVKAVEPKAPTTSAATLPTCPEGHQTLKKVPVIYGLLMHSNDLDQRLKNQEAIEGGCVIIQGYSPAYNLVCERCRYRMNPVTEEWSKENKDPACFQLPLSEIIRDFPTKLGSQPEPPNYVQHVLQGQVFGEEVYCWSNAPQPELRAKIYEYFLDMGVVPAVKPTPTHDGEWTFTFNINGRNGDLLVLHADGERTFLSLKYASERHIRTLHAEATVKAD